MWFMKHSNILISFIMCYCASTGAWTGRLWRCVIHVVIEINLISHKIARSALISVHWKIFLWPQIGNSAKDATRTRIFEVGWMSRHNRSQTNGRHFLWTFTRSRDSEIYVLSKPLLSVSLLCIAVQPDNFHLFYNIFFLNIPLYVLGKCDELKSAELRIIYSLKKQIQRHVKKEGLRCACLHFDSFVFFPRYSVAFIHFDAVAELRTRGHNRKIQLNEQTESVFEPCAGRSHSHSESKFNFGALRTLAVVARSLIKRNEFDLQIVVRART